MNLKVINLKKILEITFKDLKGFFDSLYGYILIFIFLLLAYFMFLQSFFVVGNASMQQLFNMFPVYMIVFIPAITMGSFARESDKQTLEYVLTKPVRTIEVVIGKTLAASIFGFSAVLLTIPLYFTIARIGRIDAGETFAGYIASLLLIIALSSLGVMVSSFFKNQISAFLVTCFVIFVFFIIDSPIAGANISIGLANFISTFAINNYFASVTRGVLDVGDILYFVLFTIICIVIAKVNIDKSRITNPSKLIKNSILMLAATGLLVFWMIYLSRSFEYRWDLTQAKKYTLSQVSKDILKADGKIKIDVYASTEMPEQFQYTLDEIKNQLKEYKLVAGNNVDIQYIDPKGKESELQGYGITPIQFNVIGNDQFEAKNGYLAILVKNEAGDKQEVIPYVKDINNLEYNIMRLVNKVKADKPSKLAFANGNGEYSQYSGYSTFNKILADNFEVSATYVPGQDIEENKDARKTGQPDDLKLDGYSALLIANPTVKYTDEAITKIKDFLNNGGNVIFLVDPTNIDLANGAFVQDFEEGKSTQGDMFADLGITVKNNMIYDLKSRSTVTVNTQSGIPISIPYPLFPMINKVDNSIAYAPESVMAEWPGSLEISDSSWKVLYKTSDRAGEITANYDLDPAQQFSQDNLQSYPIIASKEFDNGGKMVVISNARMFADQYISNSESNILLALSLSESMSPNSGLAQIKAKSLYNSQFTNIAEQAKSTIRFGAPIISFVLLGLIGTQRIIRKRILSRKIAQSLA